MAVALGVAALGAIGLAPAASAATTFGSNCTAEGAGVKTFAQLSRSSPSVPVKTTSAGVVTSWSVSPGAQTTRTVKLKVFKGSGSELETVAESAAETVVTSKANVFAARIAVPAGAVFGGYSSAGMLYCNGVSGDGMGYIDQETSVGSKLSFSVDPVRIIPLTVTVEPDVDGDGFGDETQDRCPQSAGAEAGCPPPVTPPTATNPGTAPSAGGNLSLSIKAKLEGNVVAVQLTCNEKATVKVSDALRGRAVAGPNSLTVEPGQTGRAYLPLSQAVKNLLAKLPRKRHLNLVIEAKGQTGSGATRSTSLELAVAGRKKAHRHHHRRHR